MRRGSERLAGSITTGKITGYTAKRQLNPAAKAGIELIAEGRHGLAEQHRVPVFEMRVSEGLWLMNKAALLQLEHFNKSNALAWALTMGLFATPVVYSDREWNQIVGESYYIQLGPQRPVWMDGAGRPCLSDRGGQPGPLEGRDLSGLLPDESGGRSAGTARCNPDSASRGISRLPRRSCELTATRSRNRMRQVLEAVNAARQDGLFIDVSGMDEFDIGDFGTELDDAKRLLDLGIQSDTMKKQLFKRLGIEVFLRHPARHQEPDCGRDRCEFSEELGGADGRDGKESRRWMSKRSCSGRCRNTCGRTFRRRSRLTKRSCTKSGGGASSWRSA